jgi:CubicO group peptidase (beta-lactamase class C family)
MRPPLPILLLLSIIAVPCASAQDPAPLRARLERAVQSGEIPGGVVSVIHLGAVVFDESFGWLDVENRRPARRDSLFFIASSTKPISTTAVLTLVRDGRLRLTDPVSRWFPELARARTTDGKPAPSPEVRHLLAHMAGFFSNEDARVSPELARFAMADDIADDDYRDWVAAMLRVPLRAVPGTRWGYGAQGLMTAGRIVELMTSRSIEDFIRERVLSPLQMTETTFHPGASERRAVVYSRKASKLERMPQQPPDDPKFILVPGGLHSTARELRQFLMLHLAEGTLGSAQVLPAALAREMRREHTGGVYRAQQPNARYEGYGLGWHVGDFDSSGVARVFAHSGALGSLLWCDAASQTGLVFLVQMPGAEVAALQREVVGMVKQIWGATP